MSRAAAVDVIEEKPRNNVYTALVIIATTALLVAFLALYGKAGEVFLESGKNLFS